MIRFDTGAILPDTSLDPDVESWVYNGLDCAVTAEVYSALKRDEDNVSAGVYSLSKSLQGPILDMNMSGILVDMHSLGEALAALRSDIARLEANLQTILVDGYGVPPSFNWRSPSQLCSFFYDYLLCPPKKKRNANGGFSRTADRGALQELSSIFIAKPAVNYLLELRDLVKQVQFLETEIDPDHRMRTSYNIAGTNTGRLASAASDFGTGSNNQNVGRRLRYIFVAPKGKKFANLDLEQADSRNVGATCWNRFVESHGEAFAGAYLDACESGDLHTTVTKMARPELDWPTDPALWRKFADEPREEFRGKSYRDASKGWGHGSNYMLTAASAVKKIPGVSIQAAIDFKETYFSAFPCIPEWHGAAASDLKNYACLTTIFGRRRYFFKRPDDPKTLREAVAYEGQSPTADEMNHGLLALWRGGRRFPGFQIVAQVHDSVLFEYDEVCEDEILPWAIKTLRVPIMLARGREFVVPTEAKVGWNWGDYNDDPTRGRINLDGLRKWKGSDDRKRLQQPRDRFYFVAR